MHLWDFPVICDFSNFLGRLVFLLHAPLTRYKHIYKCKLGDPELWRAPAPYRSKQTPRAYSDPPPSLPACYCLAYQRCCCCWMLYGAAARIQLRISGWKREDGNATGTPYSRFDSPEEHQCSLVMLI